MKRLRNIPMGTIAGGLVAVYIAVYLIGTVRHNYQLQQQIASQEAQIKGLQTSNQTLRYQIQYYQTPDYQEKEARAKLGLQAPGEGVIILPQSGDGNDGSVAPTPSASHPAPKQSNWQQWLRFLTGRAVE